MAKWWMRVNVVVVLTLMLVSTGWSQQRGGGRGMFGRSIGETGKYISVVLLLDAETAQKVEALCEKEGATTTAAIQSLRESAGDDRQALFAKIQEETDKYIERVKTGLKEILADDQMKSLDPVLTGRIPSPFRTPDEGGRNPSVWALADLDLNPEQKSKLVKVILTYEEGMQPFVRRRMREEMPEADRTKVKELIAAFNTDVAAILSPDQKEEWDTEAAKLQKQWEEEREQLRQQQPSR